eukprot:338444_1
MQSVQQLNDVNINTKLLHNLHEEQLSNGKNNSDNTLNIVNALGGIDLILRDYLDQTNHAMISRLNQIQLNQIKQIITTPERYRQANKLKSLSNIHQNHPNNIKEYTYHLEYEFCDKNIFLSKIFDEWIAHKIISILYSKSLVIINVLLAISGVWITNTMLNNWIKLTYGLLISCIIIVYVILVIMSCNQIALKKVICSFEFWFRIYITLATLCLWSILRYHTFIKISKDKSLNKLYIIATMIHYALWIADSLLWSLMICLFDALSANFVNRSYKILFSAFAAFYCLSLSIIYQFFNPEENDYIIHIHITNMIYSIISCRSLLESYLRLQCIFFFKQTLLTFCNHGKCVLIKYTPFAKWIKAQNNNKTKVVELEKKEIRMNRNENMEKTTEIVNDELFFSRKEEEFDDMTASEVVMKVSHNMSVSVTDVTISGSIAL